MLSTFNNLPGIYVNKDDGNLRILETIPGGVTVVLGTAPDGPLGKLYLVTDTGTAETLFDPTGSKNGTLLRGMFEALEGGSDYVALFRLGGSPVALDFVNGYTILSNDGSADAGSSYKLYYTNDFGGNGTEVIRIFDATTGSIIYDNVAGIDNGQFSIVGNQLFAKATKIITIGGITATLSPTFAAIKDFTDADYKIGDPVNITLNKTTLTGITTSNILKAGQMVYLEATTTGNDGYFVIKHVTKDGSNYTATFEPIEFSYSNGDIVETTFSGFVATGEATTDAATAQLIVKYIPATTGLNLTKNQLFQAYARAYWELESAKIDLVIPTGVYFDEVNVVNNEGDFLQDAVGYTQPTGNFLGKGYEFEHNGQLFFAFKNSFTNSSDIIADEIPSPYELGIDGFAAQAWCEKTHSFDTAIVCTSAADISGAADDIAYNELNFGYQLAAFLDGLSTNDNEASGSIGMTPPNNFSKVGVAQWLGKSPIIDASDGIIVVSGSGVLGYKHMAGSLGVSAGLFRTSNGYLSGSPILDRNNMPIDIGKYIDIISTPILLRSAYDGTSTGYLTAGTGTYAGLLAKTEPNESPLNKKLSSNIRLPFPLAKKYLDALVNTQYVAFTVAPDGVVKVVDAPTAALKTSDYNRRAVCRVAWGTIDIIRIIAEPYIGSLTSSAVLQNLEDVLNNTLKDLQNPQKGWLLAGQAKIAQTRAQAIRGEAVLKLTLVTANELRRLTIYLGLTK